MSTTTRFHAPIARPITCLVPRPTEIGTSCPSPETVNDSISRLLLWFQALLSPCSWSPGFADCFIRPFSYCPLSFDMSLHKDPWAYARPPLGPPPDDLHDVCLNDETHDSRSTLPPGSRPECLQNTLHECLFVALIALAAATPVFLQRSIVVVTSSIAESLGTSPAELAWSTASSGYVAADRQPPNPRSKTHALQVDYWRFSASFRLHCRYMRGASSKDPSSSQSSGFRSIFRMHLILTDRRHP